MAFDPATYTGVPFKGVTHGKMMLTKVHPVWDQLESLLTDIVRFCRQVRTADMHPDPKANAENSNCSAAVNSPISK